MRFLDLCAGIGGSRAGLEQVGWKCVLSVDSDPRAVSIHQAAFGSCINLEIGALDPESLPDHDAIVAGFPCQPFSTSGSKTGFKHRSGNVFLDIADIIEARRPRVILLENVEGLLRNQFGFSMASILSVLTGMDYVVEWLTFDASWLGIPQSRARLFLLAYDRGTKQRNVRDSALTVSALLSNVGGEESEKVVGSLSRVLAERRPRVGMRKPAPNTPFLSGGSAIGDLFSTFRVRVCAPQSEGIGDICAPSFRNKGAIRSVRYYARGGPTKPTFRQDRIAHCLGTNIGAGPTFGVPLKLVRNSKERAQVLEYSNWHRDQEEHLVFRLVPDRAIRLFGGGVASMEQAVAESDVPKTYKYVLIGNMVAPQVMAKVGGLINGGGN